MTIVLLLQMRARGCKCVARSSGCHDLTNFFYMLANVQEKLIFMIKAAIWRQLDLFAWYSWDNIIFHDPSVMGMRYCRSDPEWLAKRSRFTFLGLSRSPRKEFVTMNVILFNFTNIIFEIKMLKWRCFDFSPGKKDQRGCDRRKCVQSRRSSA